MSGFLAESFGKSVSDAQAIATFLGVVAFVAQVLAYALRSEGSVKMVPAAANKQTMLNRRNYWKFAIASATVMLIADIARRVERIGTKRAINLSLIVHARAATAIYDLAKRKQPNENLQHLKSLADSSVRFFWGQDKPPAVVAASLTAEAAVITSQIPPNSANWRTDTTFDLNGIAGVGVEIRGDAFLAHVAIRSSVPDRELVGMKVDDTPRVVAYQVEIDGLTQAIDGVLWVDSVFKGCIIRFNGREVNLAEVRFEDCDFDSSLDANPVLKRVLLGARNNPINFSSAMATDRS